VKGSVKRRCTCKNPESGKRLGAACPKLTNPRHGSWHFTVDLGTGPDGKRQQHHRGGFPTEKAAKAELSKLLRRTSEGQIIDDKQTVGEYLDEWLAGKRKLRPTTRRAYSEHIENYFKPAFGRLPLEDLRHTHIDRLVADIFAASARAVADYEQARREWEVRYAEAEAAWEAKAAEARAAGRKRLPTRKTLPKPPRPVKAVKVSTVERVLASLSAALGSAVQRRRLLFNPAAHIELPEYDAPPVNPWSAAETGRFLDAIQADRYAALFELVILEGFRRGEVCGMRWDKITLDLDAGRGVVVVAENRVDVAGKVVSGKPKTKSGERKFEIGRRSVEVLLGWRARQQLDADEWGSGWTDSGYVFTREDGKPLRPEWVTKHFKALARRAGLRPMRLHDLRHLSASLGIAAGVSIEIISKRLGHSSTRITSEIYGHLLEGVSADASDRGANMIPRANEQVPGQPQNSDVTTDVTTGP
jgi:integrase